MKFRQRVSHAAQSGQDRWNFRQLKLLEKGLWDYTHRWVKETEPGSLELAEKWLHLGNAYLFMARLYLGMGKKSRAYDVAGHGLSMYSNAGTVMRRWTSNGEHKLLYALEQECLDIQEQARPKKEHR